MKRYTLLLIVAVALLTACKKEEKTIDETQLPGKWQTGTEFWVFESNGLGHTWDPADDVTEEEAQSFSWEFAGDTKDKTLTIYHYGEMGEVIPKSYTVKELTTSTLVLKDETSGKETTYRKVE